MGTRQRIAISCARRIFRMVSGHHDPALTVASFATMTTSRPCTVPTPVTTPADGASPSYWSHATRRPISRNRVPSSQSRATRSRAVSLPWRCCFAARSGPPPALTRSSSSRTCALSSLSLDVTLAAAAGFRTTGGYTRSAPTSACQDQKAHRCPAPGGHPCPPAE